MAANCKKQTAGGWWVYYGIPVLGVGGVGGVSYMPTRREGRKPKFPHGAGRRGRRNPGKLRKLVGKRLSSAGYPLFLFILQARARERQHERQQARRRIACRIEMKTVDSSSRGFRTLLLYLYLWPQVACILYTLPSATIGAIDFLR